MIIYEREITFVTLPPPMKMLEFKYLGERNNILFCGVEYFNNIINCIISKIENLLKMKLIYFRDFDFFLLHFGEAV